MTEGFRSKRYPGEAAGGKDSVALADFQALMPSHSYIFTPTGEKWSAASVNARISPIGGGEGKAPISASTWLDRYQWVAQVTWCPGEPMLIEGRLVDQGGWLKRPGVKVLNLYRPSTIIPKAGDASLWTNHLRRMYPNDAEHLTNWLACRVQNPGIKINHSVVLGGVPGIGKDSILEPVMRAVGEHNVTEVSPAQCLGRFNGFFKAVIVRVNELHDLGEADRFTFYAHMKTPSASPPYTLRIDEKNLREHHIFNLCGIVYTNNHRNDGLYLPDNDRRTYVTWSEAKITDISKEKWQEYHNWIDNGGAEIVAHYLHKVDLSKFNPKAPPPKTRAFWTIVNAARAPENAELADALEKGGWPAAITLQKVRDDWATPELAEWLRDRRNRRAFQHRFDDCGYTAVDNEDADDRLWRVNGKRMVIYAKSNLTYHQRLDAARALNRGDTRGDVFGDMRHVNVIPIADRKD